MDQEVAKTLGELELKLQQLEHELTAIGPHDTPVGFPAPGPSEPSHPPGRLVDEAMEPSQAAEAIADGDGFDGPPVFGGEEVPAQPAATGQDWKVDVRETAYGEIPSEGQPGPPFESVTDSPGPPIPPPSPTLPPPSPTPAPPTAPPGPPPPERPPVPRPQSDPQPIDRAELVRFKQRLEQTLAELSDELGRLLLPKPPT